MNKQELINELAKYVKRYENVTDDYSKGRYGAYKVSLKLAKRLNEQNITDEQAWNKVAEAYPESAQSLRNTLDNAVFGKTGEPQKPVVPKFVAEWFEDNKHALDLTIFIAIRGLNDEEWPHKTDFENWLDVSKNKPIETLIRMKDGYEVEKEPLYEVIIGDLYLIKKFKYRNEFCFDTKRSLCAWEKSGYQLTEAEIKEIDERFWPFAVPVEEVVEG